MPVLLELTDEIASQRWQWDAEDLLTLQLTQGAALNLSRCRFAVRDAQRSIPLSRRMRVRIYVTAAGAAGTADGVDLFDGFVTGVTDSTATAAALLSFDAKTVSATTDQYLARTLRARLNAFNLGIFAPYQAALDSLQVSSRDLIHQMQRQLADPELGYADMVDLLYRDYGLLVDGTQLFGLWGYRNTVALTNPEIYDPQMELPNLGNLPGSTANIQVTYLDLAADTPLATQRAYSQGAPEDVESSQDWLVRDAGLPANAAGKDYRLAVDTWLLEREAAEIRFKTHRRLDIAARTRLQFPAGYWRYPGAWTAYQVTHDWNAATTEVAAQILNPGGAGFWG